MEDELKETKKSSRVRECEGSKEQSSKKEDIIKVLDKNLESSEKKYIKLQSENDMARN